ncbi:aspartate/tyrosine/aromatic aminotransferase [Thiovulum sp. ES]|nr:aspartate/tyrosine/aromatic aminotransferase [Thiovulum sp. ES]
MATSKRVDILSESITMAITSLARDLKREGKDVLGFSAGEPDFDTPQIIKDEAIKALNEGFTKYTAVAGIPELKDAIVHKLKRDNNLTYSPDQIIISNGAKHSLFNIFQAVLESSDEVIIPAPYWVTYPELVKYSDGVPVYIETDEKTDFKISAEQLKSAITEKTKMLILTTPSNPTGSIYTKSELEEIAEVLKDTEILVIADEMYEKLSYDGDFTAVASISSDMFERTVTINGLSKSVAMTGWRVGYLATPKKDLISAMAKLQGQSTSNINSIAQKASVVALSDEVEPEIEKMRIAFVERRDFAVEKINAIEGLSVYKPAGAFYLFVNISEVEKDSMKFSKELLETEGVALVPGIGFGLDGYVRMSFATDLDTIAEGIKRIEKFVKNKK